MRGTKCSTGEFPGASISREARKASAETRKAGLRVPPRILRALRAKRLSASSRTGSRTGTIPVSGSEKRFDRFGDARRCEAEVFQNRLAGRRFAEGRHADHGAVQADVLAPPVHVRG